MMNLKQLLASITRDAGAAVQALTAATNEVREVLGQDRLPHVELAGPVPAASLVGLVRVAMQQTAQAFSDLRTTAEVVTGQRSAPAQDQRPAAPIPAPLVAPTLASSTTTAALDAADLNESVERLTAEPALPPVDDERDLEAESLRDAGLEPEPEPQPEPDGDEESAEANARKEFAAIRDSERPAEAADTTTADLAHTNRVAAHMNGHVPTGQELAVLGVESPEGGKRGGRKPRKGGDQKKG